tara:strand:+ start:4266 stop:4661 length:396 start_codon:yes stop_codon:yes gene_type:complete
LIFDCEYAVIFYLLSGEIFFIFSDVILVISTTFGLKILFSDAGYFSIIFDGRIGRSTKFPEQLGHTFSKISSAQVLQYVHSKEQIMASFDVFGKSLLQCSQLGFICNIHVVYSSKLLYLWTVVIVQIADKE